MTLPQSYRNLLYQFYNVPLTDRTWQTPLGSGGAASNFFALPSNQTIKGALDVAIAGIDADEQQSADVIAILDEWNGWRLDPSDIDKEGYSFRSADNFWAIARALYTYTGIMPAKPKRTNRLTMG